MREYIVYLTLCRRWLLSSARRTDKQQGGMNTVSKKARALVIVIASTMVVLIGVVTAVMVLLPGSGGPSIAGEINVVEHGVDNTGATDMTDKLTELHATGKPIYYPNGTYLFNGLTLDLSGGVRFESMDGVTVRNNVSDMNILRFDKFGNLIGLMQNHLEVSENDFAPVKSGSLVSPPLSDKNYETEVDILPYWYNDFGRECQLTGKFGWLGWYYWSWNHHDVQQVDPNSDPYDPNLHPLLGFYYGDDPVVLDWQCYWMKEHAINQTAILQGDLINWEDPNSGDHWVYELFHNTPNFKNIRYAAFGAASWSGGNNAEEQAEHRLHWTNMLEKLYASHDNYYTIEKNGKEYPVINVWEEEALKTVFDPQGGHENTKAFLLEMTEAFKAKGFNGIALFSRNPISSLDTPQLRAELEEAGLIRYSSTYLANYIPGSATSGIFTYAEVVDAYSPKADPFNILGIANNMHTHTPHPSMWKCPGSTPAEFQRWVQKSTDYLRTDPDRQKIITVYNMSEWSEGSAGLFPTVGNGFGYLEAIKNVLAPE